MSSELLRFLRRALRQGTWPFLQRYSTFPRILTLGPVELESAGTTAVHVLLCERDVVMLHWMLRSLLSVWSKPFRVVIHDDGSLSRETIASLRATFIGIEVIGAKEAESRMAVLLCDYPGLLRWWPTTHWAKKALDVYLLADSKYMILLDADVLFFGEPSSLFAEESASTWMRDSSYMLDIESQASVGLFGGHPLPPLNAGVGRIERARFDLDLAAALLEVVPRPSNDMVFHAVMTAQRGDFELLPDAYDCGLESGLKGVLVRHYTNPVRFWYYEEGIPHAARNLNLPQSRWSRERI